MTRDEFYRGLRDDIDPAKLAGEGFGAVEEYFPQDIQDPYVRGDVTGYGDYYPPPDVERRRWPPYRGPR